MLAKSGIKAIFATPTRRAMETAQPLAAKLGIAGDAATIPRNPARARRKAVRRSPGAVLIVGHSNTVPDLVARFGGKQAGHPLRAGLRHRVRRHATPTESVSRIEVRACTLSCG